jgi:predicted DNA-binding helix-hairpin-helix protein
MRRPISAKFSTPRLARLPPGRGVSREKYSVNVRTSATLSLNSLARSGCSTEPVNYFIKSYTFQHGSMMISTDVIII